MEDFKSAKEGDWKVRRVSDGLLIFHNTVTGVTGEIHLKHGSVDWYDGVYELPTDVYRCLEKLDIDFDSHA